MRWVKRDLAAAGAGQVVVDDHAVVDQQLDRDGAHAGRGRHREAGLHVGDDAGRRRRAAASTSPSLTGPVGLWRARQGDRRGGLAERASALGAVAHRSAASGPVVGGRAARRSSAGSAACRGSGGAVATAGAARLRGGLSGGRRRSLVAGRRGRPSPSARRSHRGAVVVEELPPGPVDRAAGPGGTAGTARPRATRWGRRSRQGIGAGGLVWHGEYASFIASRATDR